MKKIPSLIACLALFIFVANPAGSGQLFKWVDDQGQVHYGDNPPENARLKKITGKVSSYTSVSVEDFEYDPGNVTERKRSKQVVMYSTSWCGYCKKAALHFRKNNIPFTEHDIEKSEQAAKEYKKLNGRGVPIILIGDQRMNGFNESTFDQIYHAKS